VQNPCKKIFKTLIFFYKPDNKKMTANAVISRDSAILFSILYNPKTPSAGIELIVQKA